MITFKTKMRNVSQPPRKVGEVATLIRNRSVEDALVILEHTPRRAAQSYTKFLNNVRTVAKNNYKLKTQSLLIDEVFVVAGPTMLKHRRQPKFWGPRRGSAVIPWRRRSSHIFMTIKGEALPKTKKAGDLKDVKEEAK